MVRRPGKARRFLAPLVLSLAVFGCGAEERELALSRIENARRELAALAPHGRSGFARDSIAIARERLLEAERVIRRDRGLSDLFSEQPSWQPSLQQAIDHVKIASWVVERHREAQREEAEAWIDTAAASVSHAHSSGISGVHFAVETQLRRARSALEEARRLLDAEEFSMARDKAREAAGLAGELPPETKALFERFDDPENRRKWRAWVEAGLRESKRTGRPALVVDKRARMAVLWIKGKPARWFDVELGYNGLERKLQQGDGATPEGLYHVMRRKGRGETKYYKALLLDYPNEEDRNRFREAIESGDVERGRSIGNLIEVHGEGGRGTNWTDGCVALANRDMDHLFEELRVGSAVVIVGSYGEAGESRGSGGGSGR